MGTPELRPIYFTDDEIWAIRSLMFSYREESEYIDPGFDNVLKRIEIKTDGIVNDEEIPESLAVTPAPEPGESLLSPLKPLTDKQIDAIVAKYKVRSPYVRQK